MKEITVISGKGGTGKTSLVGSLAALCGSVVIADADVDASDLPIILEPTLQERHVFQQGHRAVVEAADCAGCGVCRSVCRFDAFLDDGPANGWNSRTFRVDPLACEGCGACRQICPRGAIRMEPVQAGWWFVSNTRLGPLVHARLGPGGQNSGKLVSQVRRKARELALARGAACLLVDGSPGVGCPVIASIAQTDLVLIVTEPTPSGLHDMRRVAELVHHFGIPAMLCVNRWDLNPEMTQTLETLAVERGMSLAGRVREDAIFNAAQHARLTVVEMVSTQVGRDIREVWAAIASHGRIAPQESHA